MVQINKKQKKKGKLLKETFCTFFSIPNSP